MFKSNTWMRLSVLGSMLLASTAFAAMAPTPAPYVGLQLGWGKVHQDGAELSDVQVPGLAVTAFSSNLNHETGWAGRLFAGYLFSPMWGLELGWSKFRDVNDQISVTYSNGVTVTGNPSVKTDAIDLVVKGIYYFQNDFNIFGKLGAAYIMQRGSGSFTVGGTTVDVNEDANRLFPTFAIGLGYDFACNWNADLSWTRIQKVGSSNASSTDLVALGLLYKIV